MKCYFHKSGTLPNFTSLLPCTSKALSPTLTASRGSLTPGLTLALSWTLQELRRPLKLSHGLQMQSHTFWLQSTGTYNTLTTLLSTLTVSTSTFMDWTVERLYCKSLRGRSYVKYRAVSGVFQTIDPPPPLPPGECGGAFGPGGGHSRWVERGWGVNIL